MDGYFFIFKKDPDRFHGFLVKRDKEFQWKVFSLKENVNAPSGADFFL